MTINELQKYKITAIQETRLTNPTPQAFASNRYKHEFVTAFFLDSKVNHWVTNFTPINERLCIFRIKSRFFNYALINIHAPKNDSAEEDKDQ
jgi:hypothetical protein